MMMHDCDNNGDVGGDYGAGGNDGGDDNDIDIQCLINFSKFFFQLSIVVSFLREALATYHYKSTSYLLILLYIYIFFSHFFIQCCTQKPRDPYPT